MEKPKFANVISLIMVIGSFAFIFVLMFFEIPESNKENINTITGFLMGTCLSGVVGYFLGSSAGSETKNETIKNLSEHK